MNTSLKEIIRQYRNILAKDGIISKEELIDMLKLDTLITIKDYDKLADKILYNIEDYNPYAVTDNRKQANERRMKLYKQKLSDREIAEIEKVCTMTICHWRKLRNLPSNSKNKKDRRRKINV